MQEHLLPVIFEEGKGAFVSLHCGIEMQEHLLAVSGGEKEHLSAFTLGWECRSTYFLSVEEGRDHLSAFTLG